MKGTGDGGETKWAARGVIIFVGAYGIISLVGSFGVFMYLASKDKPIPDQMVPLLMALSATGGACMTGLLGLLGRTSTDPQHQTTTIDNSKENPVPTDPQPKPGDT